MYTTQTHIQTPKHTQVFKGKKKKIKIKLKKMQHTKHKIFKI